MSIKTQCPKCEKSYTLSKDLEGKKAKCNACDQIFEVSAIFMDTTLNNHDDDTTACTNSSIQETKVIKPNKLSFMLYNGAIAILAILLILSLILSVFIPFILFTALILGVLLIVSYWLTSIKYKKEKYTITPHKIIYDHGTLLSDTSVEIELDKVSIVHAQFPFIQQLLFKTGNIVIQTAGSSGGEVMFSQIHGTQGVYQYLQSGMQQNGFHLAQDELVQEARPHILGVIGEVFGRVLGILFVGIYIIGGIVSEIGAGESFMGIIFILMFISIISYCVVSFMDLKRRRYRIFKDTITYSEGFLSKYISYIPMENVSDTENRQSFFSKIFGLHDIVVSCQGAGNKVIFKNMTQGEKMMQHIKFLKDNIIPRKKQVTQTDQQASQSIVGYSDQTGIALNYNKEFCATYKMDFLKTTIGVILLCLLGMCAMSLIDPVLIISIIPILIILIGIKMIMIFFTKFVIDTSSIEKKFHFLSNRHTSFSVEKITSIIIKQSILDRILSTCSIKFYSIGSKNPIVFANIKKTASLETDILEKIGINYGGVEECVQKIKINFNILDAIKSDISIVISGIFMVFAILTIGSIASISLGLSMSLTYLGVILILMLIGYSAWYMYNSYYFSIKRYIRELREHHVFSRSGIFFIEKKYSLLRHIKGVKSTKYPLTQSGKIMLNIAGEEEVSQQAQVNTKNIFLYLLAGKIKSKGLSSNSFQAKYVQDVFQTHDDIDSLLHLKSINTTHRASAQQDIGNTLLWLIPLVLIVSVFTLGFALVPGLIIIGYVIWSIKVRFYHFEQDRVVFGSGIIYKQHHSILYRKFNFINLHQGLTNKIFKNGNIGIYTLGSGAQEMDIKEIDNYAEIYQLLKKD